MNYVFSPQDAGTLDPSRVGGKAANLARFSVVPEVTCPPWFAVVVEAYRAHLAQPQVEAPLRDALARLEAPNCPDVAAAAEAVRAAILAVPLPPEMREDVSRAVAELAKPDEYVAVRSSAVGEDSAQQSFAGQLDSFLFVQGAEAVLAAIRQCWASAFSERAAVYRRANDIGQQATAVAVIVQRMIRSEVSGVIFTADPIAANRAEAMVNATWGLGEGVVQGTVVTDTWHLVKADGTIRGQVRTKDECYVFDEERRGGTKLVAVPPEKAQVPCLDDHSLQRLLETVSVVEHVFGCPQDIEFAFAGGQLYLLQARPITTLPAGPEDGPGRIWDNSNIIESYAGVTTPLTFTFIRRAYAAVYDQFLETMGVPAKVRQANQELFRNMLGLIRGNVYYNLRNWYLLIRFFPGYRYNREFMESMMGVKERWTEEAETTPPASAPRRYLVELPQLLLLVARSWWNLLTVNRRMQRFLADFNAIHARFRQFEFATMTPHQLIQAFGELEEQVLRRWKPPILSDFFAMVFYGTLRKLLGTWAEDTTGGLANDLMCGDERIESAAAPRLLMEVALMLRADEAVRNRVRTSSPEELVLAWRTGGLPERPTQAIANYLDRFGDRGMNELKLEEPKPRENPAFVFAVLRNYVLADEAPNPAGMAQRQGEVREAAERKVYAALGSQGFLRRISRKGMFAWVLRQARQHVRNRENQRLARTRAFSLVRQIFLGLGTHLVKEGLLHELDDVFYLTVEEVFDFAGGTAVTTSLRELVALRRQEFAAYRNGPTPASRFETWGMVYCRNAFQGAPTAPIEAGGDCLRGTPCCGGVVRGKVRVILSPSDDLALNGEILVAEKTDPGWIPLYPSVSGLLIERGSVLSHSAIVAREMGKPAIVGIAGLAAALHDGDEVEMDGAAGTVRLLNQATPAPAAG